MATIKALLWEKENKAGECTIAIRITKNRKTTYIHTGQKIKPKYWDEVTSKVTKSHPNLARLNNFRSSKVIEINKRY